MNHKQTLDPEYDDLLFMERSTFSTFVDESQAMILLEMWARSERYDQENFLRKCGRDGEHGDS